MLLLFTIKDEINASQPHFILFLLTWQMFQNSGIYVKPLLHIILNIIFGNQLIYLVSMRKSFLVFCVGQTKNVPQRNVLLNGVLSCVCCLFFYPWKVKWLNSFFFCFLKVLEVLYAKLQPTEISIGGCARYPFSSPPVFFYCIYICVTFPTFYALTWILPSCSSSKAIYSETLERRGGNIWASCCSKWWKGSLLLLSCH